MLFKIEVGGQKSQGQLSSHSFPLEIVPCVEQDYLSSPQLRKWKRKLDHKYRSTEDKLPTPSQSYISPQDFQQ